MAEKKAIDKNQAAIQKRMKADIDDINNTADMLSGKAPIGSSRVNSGKKIKDPFAKLDDTVKLNKFLDFMESQYKKSSLIKINLSKKKV